METKQFGHGCSQIEHSIYIDEYGSFFDSWIKQAYEDKFPEQLSELHELILSIINSIDAPETISYLKIGTTEFRFSKLHSCNYGIPDSIVSMQVDGFNFLSARCAHSEITSSFTVAYKTAEQDHYESVICAYFNGVDDIDTFNPKSNDLRINLFTPGEWLNSFYDIAPKLKLLSNSVLLQESLNNTESKDAYVGFNFP